MTLKLSFLDNLPGGNYSKIGFLALLVLLVGYVHFWIRRVTANYVSRKVLADIKDPDLRTSYARAFKKNSRWYRNLWRRIPAGWGRRTQRRLAKVLEGTNIYIQKLNDMHTNPSGSESNHPRKEQQLAEEKKQASDTSSSLNEEPLEPTTPKGETEP